MITVIGTGAGKENNITLSAWNKIKNAGNVILKTEKMPVAKLLKEEKIGYITLDGIFESAEDFDLLNEKTAEELNKYKNCCYLVYGSALDDTSVAFLENAEIIPGVSLADCACAAWKKPDMHKDYTSLEVLSQNIPDYHQSTVITCIDSQFIASELKCVLTEIYGDEFETLVYREDYEGNSQTYKIQLYELDMQEGYNHTFCIYLKKSCDSEIFKCDCKSLLEIMDKLYSPGGCPWDSVQTHQTLKRYLIEEAYEVADTIDKDDPFKLCDELGDVLYQVVFHAKIAQASGDFDFTDITDSICRKMIRRHPDLFSNSSQSGDLNDNWEKIKMQEKGFHSVKEVMEDVPQGLPSLLFAEKIQHKATKAGIKDGSKEQTIKEVSDALYGINSENSLGEFLFKVVKLCRVLGYSPENVLHEETIRYINSFNK